MAKSRKTFKAQTHLLVNYSDPNGISTHGTTIALQLLGREKVKEIITNIKNS